MLNVRNLENSDVMGLIIEHGYKGYGVYCALLELQQQESKSVLLNNVDLLAYKLRLSDDDDKQLLKSILSSSLFKITSNKKYVYSEELHNFLEAKKNKHAEYKARATHASNTRWKRCYINNNNDTNTTQEYSSNATSNATSNAISNAISNATSMAIAIENNGKSIANAIKSNGNCLANAKGNNGKCYATSNATSMAKYSNKINKINKIKESILYSASAHRSDENDQRENTINAITKTELLNGLNAIDVTNPKALNDVILLLNNWNSEQTSDLLTQYNKLEHDYSLLKHVDLGEQGKEKPKALIIFIKLVIDDGVTQEMLNNELERYKQDHEQDHNYISFASWLADIEMMMS